MFRLCIVVQEFEAEVRLLPAYVCDRPFRQLGEDYDRIEVLANSDQIDKLGVAVLPDGQETRSRPTHLFSFIWTGHATPPVQSAPSFLTAREREGRSMRPLFRIACGQTSGKLPVSSGSSAATE